MNFIKDDDLGEDLRDEIGEIEEYLKAGKVRNFKKKLVLNFGCFIGCASQWSHQGSIQSDKMEADPKWLFKPRLCYAKLPGALWGDKKSVFDA